MASLSRVVGKSVSAALHSGARGMSTQTSGPYFPFTDGIKYEGPDSKNLLAFKHYNPEEVVLGKTMKEHLRFSVCYWHTFRGVGLDPFGTGTIFRPWEDGTDSMENAKRRVDVAFEFFKKLGNEYYCFHDRDVAPEGRDLAESNANLDEVGEYLLQKQNECGVKLLWGTANLFSNPRYMNGAGTNPDVHTFAYAGAQVKRVMALTHKLGGENYVFWGGREGYQSLLNTKVDYELDNAAAFFSMARDYKNSIGATYQLLLEPKAREPCAHQYDYDAMTVIAFLRTYNLHNDFKLNIEPNHTTLAGHNYAHDLLMSSVSGMLGSVDANTGDPMLGWDTDQFPMDIKDATLAMQIIIDQGGLAPGGLNFDAKVRRESTDLEDMFISHIGAMDTFARALRNVAAMREDGRLAAMRDARYATWDSSELGKKVRAGKATLDDLEAFAMEKGEPAVLSGKQEAFEVVWNDFLLTKA